METCVSWRQTGIYIPCASADRTVTVLVTRDKKAKLAKGDRRLIMNNSRNSNSNSSRRKLCMDRTAAGLLPG